MDEFRIPLQFQSGKYNFNELPTDSENGLLLEIGSCEVLTCFVPKYSTEVRSYGISEELLKTCAYAVYDDEGNLKCVELMRNGKAELLFIHYKDDAHAKAEILDYAKYNAEQISNKLMKCREKVARLFIEYYECEEGFDFACKIATVTDVQNLIDEIDNMTEERKKYWIDNCGNYPFENRVECEDIIRFSIMLQCAPPEISTELMMMAIDVMTNIIRDKVVDVLDKSEDFELIVGSYD